jgi:DNA polymerase III subunit epsilon
MIAFLDIETGGFSTTKNGVCEIALTVVCENLNVIDTFHTLIKPYPRLNDNGTTSNELVSYKDDAMSVNGLSVERLINEGIDVTQAINELVDFTIKHEIDTFAGHNILAFDIPKINHLLSRFSEMKMNYSLKYIDTLVIAKQKLNLPSYSLENLCDHFGITNEKQHSAKSDVLATIELYKKLIRTLLAFDST